MESFLSFKLPEEFVATYVDREIHWGFSIGGGNALSELVFFSKYSRLKDDGTKERWHECCRRCIEGMYSILKDHCKQNRTPWNEQKAQRSAQEAYERLFEFKWTPPGRGLSLMGTARIHTFKDSAPLNNCSFLSFEKISTRSVAEAITPFARLMEMSMLGVGVGFDTRGAGKLTIHQPGLDLETFVVPDTREGWVDSFAKLLESYFFANRPTVIFDYSQVRPAGSPIKTFGGIAPGPAPLRTLHENIRKLFLGRAGSKVTSSDIVDINNMSGKCVVSGGVRRTAEIALGDLSDKEFLNLKNWEVNPERMGADGWGYTSNNSVYAQVGDNYEHIIGNIIENGEPGIFYLDLSRQYGRLIDPPNNKDYRVLGTNPCQPGWATVLTPMGICRLDNIHIGDKIWSETGWTTVINHFETGVKDVYRYRTTAGVFYGTENHRLISGGVKIEAADCDSIDILAGPANLELDKLTPRIIMDGLVFGDGSIHVASNNLIHLYIGENDQDYFTSEVSGLIKKARPGLSDKAYEVETTFIKAEDLVHTYDRVIPDSYVNTHPQVIASFLRGLYSANGSVVSERVTFKTASLKLVEQIQIMLSSLGIRSYYTTNKPKVVTFANGDYECKESYDINITVDRVRFARLIGFIQQYKTDKLEALLGIESNRSKNTYDIKSIEYVSTELVYDITVDNDPHTYWTGGHNVSNCAEQSLESSELCTLCETFPTNCENLNDFLRTLKYAYLYGKAVTLLPTPWPESNEIMQRNRRIGCSVSGSAEFVEKYGWTELREWLNRGYEAVQYRDRTYSEWLGVRESIKTTSVKPSGTVSLVAAVTPGVHWPVADIYIRRMRLSRHDPLVEVLTEAGYYSEPDVMDPEHTVCVELPTRGPDVRTEREVSLWEKANLAILHQRYWADNQVSVTLTFKPEERDQIAPLLHATEGQLKSISLLPMTEETIYPQMPYERISNDDYERMISNIKPINWSRLYGGDALEAEGENYCTTDRCEIPSFARK